VQERGAPLLGNDMDNWGNYNLDEKGNEEEGEKKSRKKRRRGKKKEDEKRKRKKNTFVIKEIFK
jgi:hypothetical protein